jgi:hypothetical protein
MTSIKQIYEGYKNLIWKKEYVEEHAASREFVCSRCYNYTEHRFCDSCGCYVPAKSRCLDCDCPLGKWADRASFEEWFDFPERFYETLNFFTADNTKWEKECARAYIFGKIDVLKNIMFHDVYRNMRKWVTFLKKYYPEKYKTLCVVCRVRNL